MSKVFKAIGNAVTSVVKAVVNVVSTVVKAVVNVVSDVINFIASPFMGLLGGMPSVPDSAAEAQRQDGVLLTKQGGGAVAIPVVYGYRKLGGVITFCETGSTNNKYLWVAYTFAEGPVEGVFEISIDDTILSADVVRGLNSGQIVDVPDAKYKGRVQLQWFPGVYFTDPRNSGVGAISILKDAPSWKPSMVYNGMAVLFARYEWLTVTTQAQADANPFSGGIPQVQINLLGKKVASLRTGAGTENYSYQGSGYVERYSTNPAEILLDYLRNPRYGKGLVNTDIDWDSFYIAAQKCNQVIDYTTSVTGPILTMNIVLDSNQTLFANIKNLLANFRAYLPYVQGKYKLKIEDAGNPTDIKSGAATIAAVFNRDSILGDITYTGIERSAKYNQVVVSYVDPDQKFSVQQVVYPEDEAARQVYIGYDGGRENKSEITFSGITNQQIARDFARLIFNKSRYQETCSLTVTAEGFNLEPGDNVYINSNILNFGTTPWRIVSIKLNNDYTFDLGCVRNPDFIYPYVIPNTPDTVIAPYIPKGASILPPLSGGGSLIGLVPPSTAPLLPPVNNNPVTPINTGTNPPTTITTGTNGGGVGGGPTSGSPVNPGPPENPIINILTDVVTLDRVDYKTVGTDVASATIYFNQPAHVMFTGLQVYYRIGTDPNGPWAETFVSTLAGAGKTISFVLNNLLSKNSAYYDIRTRVKYSTGEYSTRVGTAQLYVGEAIAKGVLTADPNDSSISVASGWSLPTTSAARYDDYFEPVTARNIKSGGSFTNPRSITVTLSQNVTGTSPNTNIKGVRVYYKPTNTDYYYTQDIDFSPSYVAGASTTITVSGLGVPGSYSNYDFIFVARYLNGNLSTRWTRRPYATLEVDPAFEIFTGLAAYGETIANTTIKFTTVEQGVTAGTITNAVDMKIGVAGLQSRYLNVNNSFTVWIYPPDATADASWLGVRIYRRKVIAGTNPAYEALPDYIRSNANKGSWNPGSGFLTAYYFRVDGVEFSTEYQYLIVPLVASGFTTVEGNFSFFGQGVVRDDTTGIDQSINLGFNRGDTSQLKGQLSATFAAPAVSPTAVVTSWRAVNTGPAGNANPILAAYGVNGSVNFIQNYYEVAFSVDTITNFNEVYIYRRRNIGNQNKASLYYGIGQYERLTFNTSFSGYSSGTKTFTIKLKLPATYFEYSSTNTTAPGRNGSAYPATQVTYDYPPVTTNFDEYYIVIRSNSATSGKAIKLPGYAIGKLSSQDISSISAPQIIDWPMSEDASFAAGWNRKISEARVGSANSSTSAISGSPLYMGIAYGGRNVAYVSSSVDPGVY